MFDGVKAYLWVVGFVLLVVFTVGGISMVTQGTFLPWQERIRRETFEQSQSYVHGKINQLNRLRMDYGRAQESDHKCAIRSTALHEAATATELPADLGRWVTTLKGDTTCGG